MNRVRIMQIILAVAIFFGGLQCGLDLSEIFRSEANWWKLAIPGFTSVAMIWLLILSIVKPEHFTGKKD